MSYTSTGTKAYSHTISDVETVMRRFTADLVMIAQSSAAIPESEARDLAHDIELLAKGGYLRMVDITLLDGQKEIRAIQYLVNESTGELAMSRPGGVMWPRAMVPILRIVVTYSHSYNPDARARLRGSLKYEWVASSADTSHARLRRTATRDYWSNGWGLQRYDYGL